MQNKIRKGFSLIELLVVIAVLGSLATIVVLRFTGSQASARDARRQSDLRQYQAALEVYANRSNSLYPIRTTTVNISTNLCGTLGLSNCPSDPQQSPSVYYSYQSNPAGTDYVLWAYLERRNTAGQSEIFVLCSNGKAGKTSSSTSVSGGNCPI